MTHQHKFKHKITNRKAKYLPRQEYKLKYTDKKRNEDVTELERDLPTQFQLEKKGGSC